MDSEDLMAVLRRFAGTLLGDYSLEGVLGRLSSDTRRLIHVRGAGVMLEDGDGNLRFLTGSDPVLDRLESLQIELDQGPCLLAYRRCEPVFADDLRTDPRFPEFGPRAAEAGMGAVFSYPLRHGMTRIGALNFYRDHAAALTEEQQSVAQTLADIATAYLIHAREDDRSRLLTTQLQGALESRVIIEQAKGYVVGKLDLPVDEAFELLRTYARSTGTPLRAIAHEVLERRLSVDKLRKRG